MKRLKGDEYFQYYLRLCNALMGGVDHVWLGKRWGRVKSRMYSWRFEDVVKEARAQWDKHERRRRCK